ncbi:hypothetical protein CEXT_513391 [Caerostris extrusa]|uniref:Reverse transcriptase n=1 Tax=Caerostris extrusa TaxID=172846 RepID=A0AAV4N4Z1_CAEEX|nr:hypothetical protein CEXT_513391 [Caerostris extrusa]
MTTTPTKDLLANLDMILKMIFQAETDFRLFGWKINREKTELLHSKSVTYLILGCTFHFGAFVPIRRLSRPWKEGEDSERPINHALRAVVDDGEAFSCQENFGTIYDDSPTKDLLANLDMIPR